TRSGDIDPGIVMHLNRVAKLGVDQIDTLLNKQSGLKGLCGENDFRTITEKIEAGDAGARKAYDVYIHRLRRYIGAYMIELGRVDAITFTAGVGENAAGVRADALANLQNYGIVIDDERNALRGRYARRISADESTIEVLVVPTNEELAIARQSAEVVAQL
ncbi:acetate kinase, partial [Streptomyces sp. SID10244]|nr:acetate kinase [Streptomyces sp. SID10244]